MPSKNYQSIRDGWDDYARMVIPQGADAVQIEECHRAFYAGASYVVLCVMRMGKSDVSDDMAKAMIDGLLLEVLRFKKDVGMGRPWGDS
jgi:hypothetical protein